METRITNSELPSPAALDAAVVAALTALGGDATNEQLRDRVVRDLGLPEELLALRHGHGNRTELEYRMAWARTRLKHAGVIVRAGAARWALASKLGAPDRT
jgi:restriction system protein